MCCITLITCAMNSSLHFCLAKHPVLCNASCNTPCWWSRKKYIEINCRRRRRIPALTAQYSSEHACTKQYPERHTGTDWRIRAVSMLLKPIVTPTIQRVPSFESKIKHVYIVFMMCTKASITHSWCAWRSAAEQSWCKKQLSNKKQKIRVREKTARQNRRVPYAVCAIWKMWLHRGLAWISGRAWITSIAHTMAKWMHSAWRQ